MAATPLDLTTLGALCDVFIPAVKPPSSAPVEADPFFMMTATGLGTHTKVGALLEELLDEAELADLGKLLGVLRAAGIRRLPWRASQKILAGLAKADADARDALKDLRALTMVAHYGGTPDVGTHPSWTMAGYGGPPPTPSPGWERLVVMSPDTSLDHLELEADAVIVGSGAGGGVAAARLAAAGMRVLVLEAGGAYEEADFAADELSALRQLYWRGGLSTTEDGNVTILAGGTLGGGTTVNWSNCVAPPQHVLRCWQEEHGVDGMLDGDMAAALDAVSQRMGVTDEHTQLNGPNQRLQEGAKALGWAAHLTARNVDGSLEDAEATGHTGFGDRTGAKQGSLRTWLRDAVDAGAQILTRCTVDRVTVADGVAAGVVGHLARADGSRIAVTVRAATVVLAAGALETPAILLRSAIGGPAVGRHLRLHPVPVITGVYEEPQRGFSGPPQGLVVTERAAVHDGHGYLVEAPAFHPGLTAAAIAWPDAREHRVVSSRAGNMAGFIAVTRERGSGSVTLDAEGQGLVHYPLDDPFDIELLRAAVTDLAKLHEAAGAKLIIDLDPTRAIWRRGEPLEGFVDKLLAIGFGKDQRTLFSAHQMGTARMGADPRTSVTDPDGQLHDTPGVWVSDTSLFPTAVGSNPMLTVMALAHRVAGRIVDAS